MPNSLFNTLCLPLTLHSAWKTVKSKNAAGGIDGFSVAMFDDDLKNHLTQLQKELRDRSWNPNPYLRVEIPKTKTKNGNSGPLRDIKSTVFRQNCILFPCERPNKHWNK